MDVVLGKQLLGVLVPSLAAAAPALALLALARWRGVALTPARAGLAGALGVGLAYPIGHAGVVGGWPALPPTDVTHWPLVLAPAAAAWGALEARLGRGGAARVVGRWFGRAGLVTLALLLMTRPLLEHTWAGGEAVLRLGGFALCAALLSLGLDALARERAEGEPEPQAGALLALLPALGGGALVIALFGHSAKVAELCGVLAAAAGVLAALAWRAPALTPLAGVATPLAALFTCQLVNAVGYAELHPGSALLLAAAPGAAALRPGRAEGGTPSWRGALIGLALSGALVLAAGGLAWATAPAAVDPYEMYAPY